MTYHDPDSKPHKHLPFASPGTLRHESSKAGRGRSECDRMAELLWDEHGWSLTGWQVCAIVGGLGVVSLILQYLT